MFYFKISVKQAIESSWNYLFSSSTQYGSLVSLAFRARWSVYELQSSYSMHRIDWTPPPHPPAIYSCFITWFHDKLIKTYQIEWNPIIFTSFVNDVRLKSSPNTVRKVKFHWTTGLVISNDIYTSKITTLFYVKYFISANQKASNKSII